ncbi:MAG: DUF421 domain-containing protein [Oscillospiraceae bacterium]|nr:DUF421 domain-containing protein [Oscillospiraceae bacterium]
MIVGFLRALILYLTVIFSVRLMGKRQIGELQPSELVVTILISNITTLPLENQEFPLLPGLVTVLTIVCAEVLLSYASLHNKRLRRLISGSPQLVIRNGEIDQQAMANLRFSLDDLMTALRTGGTFDVTEVQSAIVETNGTVSVYLKPEFRPVTCGDMECVGEDTNPPEVLVADGRVSREGMAAAGFSDSMLEKLLKKKKMTVADIFLLTVDGNGVKCLVRKDGMR